MRGRAHFCRNRTRLADALARARVLRSRSVPSERRCCASGSGVFGPGVFGAASWGRLHCWRPASHFSPARLICGRYRRRFTGPGRSESSAHFRDGTATRFRFQAGPGTTQKLSNAAARRRRGRSLSTRCTKCGSRPGGRDDVRIQAEFELGARGDRWLRVPLRLGECALTEPPQHAGRDEFLHFNDEKGGYDWWIRPRPPASATAGTNGAGASSSVAPASDPTEVGPTPEPASPTPREAESPSGAAPAGSGGANSGMGMGMGMAVGSAMNAAIGNGAAATPTEGEQRFRLALHLVMPVEHVGGERRGRWAAPRSNRSQLRLTVPGDQALGTLWGRLAEAPDRRRLIPPRSLLPPTGPAPSRTSNCMGWTGRASSPGASGPSD